MPTDSQLFANIVRRSEVSRELNELKKLWQSSPLQLRTEIKQIFAECIEEMEKEGCNV